MCMVCHHNPCLPGCPNADEPKAATVCEKCGRDICDGDKYFASQYGDICEDCLDAMTTKEFLELFDEELQTAEHEGFWEELA